MKKQIFLFLLCLCSMSMLFPQSIDPPPWLGDVDANEVIDIIDALLTAQYYVGLTTDPLIRDNGDANWDGNVDIVDALLLAQYYVGLIEYLPGDSIYGKTQKELAINKRKWKDLRFYTYQIESRIQNFFFPYSQEILLVNVDIFYVISAFFKDTNEPIDETQLDELVSVDELFTIVQTAIDEKYIIYDIQFNEEFGYVSRFNYEVSEDLEDDRVTYEIFDIRSNRDIQITGENPADLLNDHFQLYQPKIVNNVLLLPIRYGGGCEIHDFILYARDVFMESDPPQVNLYLYHEAYNDPCLALPTDNGGFNLEPLAELYYSYYQSYNTMIINIHKDNLYYPDPVAFSIPYTPVITEP